MSAPFMITSDFVMSLDPCWARDDVEDAFAGRESVSLSYAVSSPQLDADDAIWLGCRSLWEIDRATARRFACVAARWTSMRFGHGEQNAVTRVVWRHIHGRATNEELAAAWDAARAAAWDAARAAAWDAARAAAWDAAWAAARAAAWDAARAAARAAAWDAARAAAWDAAWDADWAELRAHLVRMIRRAEASL